MHERKRETENYPEFLPNYEHELLAVVRLMKQWGKPVVVYGGDADVWGLNPTFNVKCAWVRKFFSEHGIIVTSEVPTCRMMRYYDNCHMYWDAETIHNLQCFDFDLK